MARSKSSESRVCVAATQAVVYDAILGEGIRVGLDPDALECSDMDIQVLIEDIRIHRDVWKEIVEQVQSQLTYADIVRARLDFV